MCEEGYDSLDDGHEEENLEAELELRSNVCRFVHLLCISGSLVNCLVVSLIGVAVDRVLVHVKGEVAVDATKENCVDESGWWASLTAVLHCIWNAHFC